MADQYLEKLLGNGETVIYATRQHWFVLMRNIFVEGVAIIAIALVIWLAYPIVNSNNPSLASLMVFGLVFEIVPIISLLLDFFQWFNRKFIVTSWRVIQLSGVINKDVIDSSLEKVNDVKLTQSFLGRIFNFGTVEILTASELGVNEFKTIGSPVYFKTTIINAKEVLEREGSQKFMPKMAAPAPAPASNIAAQLAQMEDLHKTGVLNDEEFKRIKDTLISKL